jgi:hypothetical protein
VDREFGWLADVGMGIAFWEKGWEKDRLGEEKRVLSLRFTLVN